MAVAVGAGLWMFLSRRPTTPPSAPRVDDQPMADEAAFAPPVEGPPSAMGTMAMARGASWQPSPPSASRLDTPSPGPSAMAPLPSPLLAETTLLDQVRALVKTDPVHAEALARESRQRFPDGKTADERDALLVDALVNQQRIGAARDESYYYFDHHPGGQFAEHLFITTGARPTPRAPQR